MSSKSQNARISLNISPTCHPEIDDLSEKVNQIMEVNLLADLVKKPRTHEKNYDIHNCLQSSMH